MPRLSGKDVHRGGLGGLTAAELYARTNKRVLILERNAQVGSTATVHTHAGLAIGGCAARARRPRRGRSEIRPLSALRWGSTAIWHSSMPSRSMRCEAPRSVGPSCCRTGWTRQRQQCGRAPAPAGRARAVFQAAGAAAQAPASDALAHPRRQAVAPAACARAAVDAVRRGLRDRRVALSEVLDRLFGSDEAVKFALAARSGALRRRPRRDTAVPRVRGAAGVLPDRRRALRRGGSRALSERFAAHRAGGRRRGGNRAGGGGDRDRSQSGSRCGTSPVAAAICGRRRPQWYSAAPPRRCSRRCCPKPSRTRFGVAFRDRAVSTSLWTVFVARSPARRAWRAELHDDRAAGLDAPTGAVSGGECADGAGSRGRHADAAVQLRGLQPDRQRFE